MDKSINLDEINALVATEIRKKGLDGVLNLNTIKERVIQKLKETSTKEGMVEMENPTVKQGPVQLPKSEEDEEQFRVAPGVVQTEEPSVQAGRKPGTEPLDLPNTPKMGIAPEVPDFLKDVEPEKIFVYDFNELSVGGENLSNKPFKTLDNPEITKSMHQMWSEKGVTKAEVYQTKFEKIGDVVFDYKSGSSQFIERGAEPDFEAQQSYKENPYASDPTKEIESYIKNNVDIESKVNDVITNIVKGYFLTNSERAVNDQVQQASQTNVSPGNAPQPVPMQPQKAQYVNESKITINKLVHEFEKVDTPQPLLETINGKSKEAKLIYEDNEVKKWSLNGKEYYFLADPISIRKCYVKN